MLSWLQWTGRHWLEMVSGQNIYVKGGEFVEAIFSHPLESILSCTVGWKVWSSGTVLHVHVAWSWCHTGMTCTVCLVF